MFTLMCDGRADCRNIDDHPYIMSLHFCTWHMAWKTNIPLCWEELAFTPAAHWVPPCDGRGGCDGPTCMEFIRRGSEVFCFTTCWSFSDCHSSTWPPFNTPDTGSRAHVMSRWSSTEEFRQSRNLSFTFEPT